MQYQRSVIVSKAGANTRRKINPVMSGRIVLLKPEYSDATFKRDNGSLLVSDGKKDGLLSGQC